MLYVARIFKQITGHRLKGLGEHTGWIRAKGYYHWKMSKLNQLEHCPHLRGLPVPRGPIARPSSCQQPQKPNKPKAPAAGASGHDRAEESSDSDESPPMVGAAGDGQSWYEQMVWEDAWKKAHKRKRMEVGQQAPSRPFSLGSGPGWEEAVSAIYRHVVDQDPPQTNITSMAVSSYYPHFTPAAVKTLAGQVLCMIVEYHLACVTRCSATTNPILPEEIEEYLPPLMNWHY